jgi:hypothetical protein
VKPGKLSNALLLAGIALCLVQVWVPAYFLTGDGPCHVYNAQILHDLWSHRNVPFYTHFYDRVTNPNPNWLSHLLLAALMFVMDGVFAEKILLTIYIILFVSGFYLLLRKIEGRNTWWQLLVFMFVFHHFLAKGFYNFSLSTALLFWFIRSWLLYLESNRVRDLVVFFILSLLVFFAHPMAFAFGALTAGSLTLSHYFSGDLSAGGRRKLLTLFHRLFTLFMCLLPAAFLIIRFAASEGGSHLRLHLYRYRFVELPHFDSLINLAGSEVVIVRIIWMLLFALLLSGLVLRFRKGMIYHKYDGFLISLVFTGFLYFTFPDELFGGGLFIFRTQYLMSLFVVLCITYLLPPGMIRNGAGILLFCCFVALSIIRFSTEKIASDAVTNILSAGKYIRPYSVMLPLDFAPGGKDLHGNTITDRNWIFSHVADYLGSQKPLIILDNYEANTGYFPLVWTEATNPYHHLSINGSMEAMPPYGTIQTYSQKTGVSINYILMWCYDSTFIRDEKFARLYDEINRGYNIIYASPGGRTILYERK